VDNGGKITVVHEAQYSVRNSVPKGVFLQRSCENYGLLYEFVDILSVSGADALTIYTPTLHGFAKATFQTLSESVSVTILPNRRNGCRRDAE